MTSSTRGRGVASGMGAIYPDPGTRWQPLIHPWFAVALLTGRFDLRRVPLVVTMLLSVFLALNMLASFELIDVTRGVTFFAITFYLAVFGLWLAGYVQSAHRARVILRAYVAAAVL